MKFVAYELSLCITILLFVLLMIYIGGCRLPLNMGGNGARMDDLPSEGIVGGVQGNKGLNSLKVLFIVGSALSLFVGLNGLKAGWLAMGSCLFGLWLSTALQNVWVYWAAGIALLGVVVLVVVSIWRKNTALKEIVRGIEMLRDKREIVDITRFQPSMNQILSENQSKGTQKQVDKIKEKLEKNETS